MEWRSHSNSTTQVETVHQTSASLQNNRDACKAATPRTLIGRTATYPTTVNAHMCKQRTKGKNMDDLLGRLAEITKQLLEIRVEAAAVSNDDHMVSIYAKDAIREVNKLHGELLMHQ